MSPTLISLGALVLLFLPRPGLAAVCHRFDFGAPSSPVKPGYVRLGVEDVYDASRGVGWEEAPTEAFDRPRPLQQAFENILPDDLLRDGVTGRGDLVFRLDVPNGEYWLRGWIGDTREPRGKMRVAANGTDIVTGVDTSVGWGAAAPGRSFRSRIRVTGGTLRVRFSVSDPYSENEHECNSVLGLEFVEYQPLPVIRENGRLIARGFESAAFQAGTEAYDRGDLRAAERHFSEIPGPDGNWPRAVALLYLADHLDCEAPQPLVERARQLLQRLCERAPHNTAAAQLLLVCDIYLTAREWMTGLAYSDVMARTGISQWRRLSMADDRLRQILPDEPLYYRALLNLGRIHYWLGRETGSQEEYGQAAEQFARLAKVFPHNRLVRMYAGEQVEWGAEYGQAAADAPRWAVAAREALGRSLDVVRWWIENRQRPNGEMGGSFGDDVEMLRSWSFARACLDDPVVAQGWRRLADGVWNSGEVEDGYSRELGDVQHSAELTADSQPALIGWEYGDPTYLERALQTMRLFRDVWTGVNSAGHRHFMSAQMSATEIQEGAKWGVDLPYHARATIPGLWVAWYSGNPEVKRLLAQWGDAWVADTRRSADGKPAGILPAAIAYDTERLGGYGPTWWDPDIFWSYFVFPGGTAGMFEHLVGVWQLTGDEKYLEPMHAVMAHLLVLEKEPAKNPQPGSLAWAASQLGYHMRYALAKWRVLSGDTRYDAYLARHGDAYARWMTSGDKSHLVARCEDIIRLTKHNFPMLTDEVLFTDRIGLAGTGLLFAMYTGGAGLPGYYPAHAITWSGVTRNFAALVLRADTDGAKILAYNFEPNTERARLRFWRSGLGRYRLSIGDDLDQDDAIDAVRETIECTIKHRGEGIEIALPSRALQVIQIERLEAAPDPAPLPDLAFGPGDVRLGEESPQAGTNVEVDFTIHNIGIADAHDVWVNVYDGEPHPDNLIIKRLTTKIHGADSLTARHFTQRRRWVATPGEHTLTFVIDPDDEIPEISEDNNRATLRVVVR